MEHVGTDTVADSARVIAQSSKKYKIKLKAIRVEKWSYDDYYENQ
jgi:hypothetical protein